MNDIKGLYGWVFTFNPYTGNYRCCTRDDLNRLFSEPEENFLRSKNIEDLEEIIIKAEGDINIINQLIVKDGKTFTLSIRKLLDSFKIKN